MQLPLKLFTSITKANQEGSGPLRVHNPRGQHPQALDSSAWSLFISGSQIIPQSVLVWLLSGHWIGTEFLRVRVWISELAPSHICPHQEAQDVTWRLSP